MKRPDVEKYEAMAEAADAYIAEAWKDASRAAIPELCAWAKRLAAILRDWLDACPETCGQCEGVHERAEEAGK